MAQDREALLKAAKRKLLLEKAKQKLRGESEAADTPLPRSEEDDSGRPWYSVSPEGLSTVVQGTLKNAPFGRISEAAYSAGKAGLQAITDGEDPRGFKDYYNEQQQAYSGHNQQIDEQLGTAGNILSAAPYLATKAMSAPVESVLAAADAGGSTLVETGDPRQAIKDAGTAGLIASAIPAAVGTKNLLNQNTVKGMGKLPGKVLGKSDAALERYYQDPKAVKLASKEREVRNIAEFGQKQTQALEEATQALDNAKFNAQQALENYKLVKSKEAAAMQSNNEAAKLQYKTQQAEAAQALEEAQNNFRLAKEQHAATKADLERGRTTQIKELEESVRNVPDDAVEEAQKAVKAQQQQTRGLSMEQARLMDESGKTFDISGLKESLKDAAGKKALPLQKGNQPEAVAEVERLAESLNDTATATELLNLRQTLGKLGFKEEIGKPGTKSAYYQINEMLDSPVEGLGSEYTKVRQNLSDNVNLRKDVKKVENYLRNKLAGVGGRNDVDTVNLINKLQEKTDTDIMSKLSPYLEAKKQLNELRRTKVAPDAAELKAAEQAVIDARNNLRQVSSNPPKLEKPVVEQIPNFSEGIPELADNVTAAKARAKEFGYDTQSAQSLVEGNFEHTKDYVWKGDELNKVAEEMNDPNMIQRIKDAGFQDEFGKRPAAGSKWVQAGKALFGGLGGLTLSGGNPVLAAAGAAAGLATELNPAIVSQFPLDVARKINKLASIASNSKAIQALNKAAERGNKAVQSTHYLLQLSDPEYRQAMQEENED